MGLADKLRKARELRTQVVQAGKQRKVRAVVTKLRDKAQHGHKAEREQAARMLKRQERGTLRDEPARHETQDVRMAETISYAELAKHLRPFRRGGDGDEAVLLSVIVVKEIETPLGDYLRHNSLYAKVAVNPLAGYIKVWKRPGADGDPDLIIRNAVTE